MGPCPRPAYPVQSCTMSPEEFIDKWRAVTVSEIAASQSHFNDLCELLDVPKPLDVDPTGERYAFEKHLFNWAVLMPWRKT